MQGERERDSKEDLASENVTVCLCACLPACMHAYTILVPAQVIIDCDKNVQAQHKTGSERNSEEGRKQQPGRGGGRRLGREQARWTVGPFPLPLRSQLLFVYYEGQQ